MGTNYYIKSNVCPCCGRRDPDLHIGKSSCGWCFALHVYPEDQKLPQSLDDWEALFNTHKIFDEYGDEIPKIKMLSIILKRSRLDPITEQSIKKRISGIISYKSVEDYLHKNHAVLGPNNLLRHKIDGSFCIGHGPVDATYDLITGEFS